MYYPGVALIVYGISAAVEVHVVAVDVGVNSADVDTCDIGVHQRPMRITCALMKILSGAAVSWHMIVAKTFQEITAKNCAACGRVVGRRRVVFIAFAVNEILAYS